MTASAPRRLEPGLSALRESRSLLGVRAVCVVRGKPMRALSDSALGREGESTTVPRGQVGRARMFHRGSEARRVAGDGEPDDGARGGATEDAPIAQDRR
jgi:hypothetical protein